MMTESVNIIINIICVQEYCSAFLCSKIAFQMLTFFFFSEVKNKVSLLSAKHLWPVNSRGESINKEMKFVDIFAWWLISPTDFRTVSTLPSPHIRPTKLSQALCVSDQIEETREDNVRYYVRLLGATFCSGPPGIRGLVHSPFPLPLLPSTRSLKHDCQCDSGSQLGQWLPSPPSRHPIPACLGLQTASSDLLAQFPALHGGTRLGTEVQRLEWGQKRGRGRTSGHIWTGISFHSPLLSFSPYYQSVWCQICLIWGERRDTKCRQILKVAADYFRRRKYPLLLWGLHLIRLSAAGVKEGTQVPLFERKYKQVMYSSGHPPSARALWNSLHQQPFLLHLSAWITLPWLQLSCCWMHQISLMFNLECTQQPWPDGQAAAHLQPTLLPSAAPDESRSRSQELLCASKEKELAWE